MMRYLGYPLGYLWALPNTLVGVAFLPLTLLCGGGVRFQWGVMELHGGFAAWFLRNVCGGVWAMTLGHVILGRDRAMLDHTRNHEHVHVVQYMLCGPLFLPLYGLSSFLCWCKSQDYYRENWFEKPAFRRFPC